MNLFGFRTHTLSMLLLAFLLSVQVVWSGDAAVPLPELPDMTNGGILVFFHVYKTGGSSVTELIMDLRAWFEEEQEDESQNRERVMFFNNREEMTHEDIEFSIDMVHEHKLPLFYNFHVEFPSTMYPTLVEAQPLLDEWRSEANEAGVPFFAMTILREPLGHALSFFNFFHVATDEEPWSPFTGDLEPTEDNFLRTYVPNRLCHLLYDDAHGILEAPDFALREGLLEDLHHFMDEEELNRRNEPSNCNLEKVQQMVFEDKTFDYVGVTEKLSTHILPMVCDIMFGDPQLAVDAEPKKKADEVNDEDVIPLKKHVLSESTIQKVAEESAKDQLLYEMARDKFAHWPAYFTKEEIAAAAAAAAKAEEEAMLLEQEEESRARQHQQETVADAFEQETATTTTAKTEDKEL